MLPSRGCAFQKVVKAPWQGVGSALLRLQTACGGLLLGLISLLSCAHGDINFPHFSRDPSGKLSDLRLIGGSQVDYYSTEFNELCPAETTGPIRPQNGMTQRFQHPEFRSDPNEADLPDYRYLDDTQLDNPNAGRVSHGEHTEVVVTKAFIPDDDLIPLPHNRTQLCHYALRLTPPENMKNTASWYRFKQLVAYGFVTEFHFRILHRQKECLEVGKALTYCPHSAAWCEGWCQEQGGDGFAFVIQNFGRKAVGSQVNGMGYGFKQNLAIEFDTLHNVDFEEKSGNHISVHMPTSAEQANTANHYITEIAHSDDIPPLTEGTHVVRIEYDPRYYSWDDLGRTHESDNSGAYSRQMSSGRAGLLSIDFDGRRVISVPLDINQIARVDNMVNYQADPPTAPNKGAYDEGGGAPGRAWVGFTSSTSYSNWQSVDILSWTFEEKARCPHSGGPTDSHLSGPSAFPLDTPHRAGDREITCRVDKGTVNPTTCTIFNDPLCGFIVRNIGRQPIKFSVRMRWDRPYESWPCDNGMLEWDMLHPYFLGCRREIHYTHDLADLQITTLDGTRSIVVNDDVLLQKKPIPFMRRSKFEQCVMEHKYDIQRLYFAECNCEFCVRLLTLQQNYAVFFNDRCTARYGLVCPCFEASEVSPDSSSWTRVEPLKNMRLHTCRGCVFASQCSQMLKVATCEKPVYQTYVLGNPVAPVPLQAGFQNLSRDSGRVLDGRLAGDSCNCEPEVQPYRGDPDGRKGQCADSQELDRIIVPELDLCAAKCANTPKCGFLVYWDDGDCRVYLLCPWVVCTDLRCIQAGVYRMAPLGPYIDTRGEVQKFQVYPVRLVQVTRDACFRCLHLYDDEFCVASCGPGLSVPYLHWPGGQSCSTCIFAGNRLHELTLQNTKDVKACVYEATRRGEDPWVACDHTSRKVAEVPSSDLFNGVSTHYLSECPGRNFLESGALCVPNVLAMNHFPSQVLSRMAAKNNTVWRSHLECLNAVCHIVPRASCYKRMALFSFSKNASGILMNDYSGIVKGTGYNGAYVREEENALRVNKYLKQYVVSDPLPFALENNTLEAWIEIDSNELVSDVAINVPTVADTNWEEDYISWYGVDGGETTYWSSQLGEVGTLDLYAIWWMQLPGRSSVEEAYIHWFQPAADFRVQISYDNFTWDEIFVMWENQETTTHIPIFFQANYVRIIMTKASVVRLSDPGKGRPVCSIYEFEAMTDMVLSRLKPTIVNYIWHLPSDLARDQDNTTLWATEPGTKNASLFVDFGSLMTDISVVVLKWRFMPLKFTLYTGAGACNGKRPPNTLQIFSGAQILELMEDTTLWEGQCLLLEIDQVATVWGQLVSGLFEVEVYRESTNLATTATVVKTDPIEDPLDPKATFLTPVSGALDGNPNTYWMIQPTTVGRASLTVDLGAEKLLTAIKIRWATVAGFGYFASDFSVHAGTDLNQLLRVDFVVGNFVAYRRFVLFQRVRYVQLRIQGIMFSNPMKRVALEDLIIHAASDNLASLPTTQVVATSEWANCPDCDVTIDGAYRLHGSHAAADANLKTWWGVPLGISQEGLDYATWQVTFDVPLVLTIVVIRWRYPAASLSVWCAYNVSTKFAPAGFVVGNKDYLTPIVFSSPRTCRVIQIYVAVPVERFAKEGIIGIQEVEIYNTDTNLALGAKTHSTDGQDASLTTDASDQSKWLSKPFLPTCTLTFDMITPVTGWAIRTLWSSGLAARGFEVGISNDNITYRTLKVYENNEYRDVYTVEFFTARYIRIVLRSYQQGTFTWSLRTMSVYGSANYAAGKPTYADKNWDHTGTEACDGVNTTFWVAEPLATSSFVQVDLQGEYFVGDGVKILWKFPAQDFAVVYSVDATAWDVLYEVKGNMDTYTEIQTNFVARYVQIRMTRPSLLNGDGAYAILSFDVLFDPNLAHGKVSLASHTIDNARFAGRNAIDQQPGTIWMPPQNSDRSEIVIDLLGDFVVSRFELLWRHPPSVFELQGQHVVTLQYFLVQTYKPAKFMTKLETRQHYSEGFVARRIKIAILEVASGSEGKICSLRDVLMYTYKNQNLAKGASIQFSDEISGNRARLAVDGNQRGTYWLPGEGIRTAWLLIQVVSCNNPVQVARTSLWWRFAPGSYMIEFYADPVQGWGEVFRAVDQTDLFTDFYKYRMMCTMKLNIYDEPTPLSHDIGLFDISVYPAKAFVPPAVGPPEGRIWDAAVANVNDRDVGTYWMAPPWSGKVNIWVDLGAIYLVYDIFIWFVLLSQGFSVWVSTAGFDILETQKKMTSTSVWGRMRLETRGIAFQARYLRIEISKSYQDPEFQLGTSIRDIAVYQFRNLAQSAPTSSTSVWSYPASWVTDNPTDEFGNPVETYWMSKFYPPTPDASMQPSATVMLDLGIEKNVAGVSGFFAFIPGYYRIDRSLDNITWFKAYEAGNNNAKKIVITNANFHFKARYLRVYMDRPKILIDHPDKPGDKLSQGYVFGMTNLSFWEHTGGGGAVGIQNLDGTEFSTIVWGQRQPGQWTLGSEGDSFTKDLGGGAFNEDIGNVAHIVVTFEKVKAEAFGMRRTQMKFYRNGVSYGTAYSREAHPNRLRLANQTRLVFGVRSTIFANESKDLTDIAGLHGITHSPYLWGKIHNVTLLQNALSPEEVLGLYTVVSGGEELGCHCYDACPAGFNRFNRSVPVPCSGQGVCMRDKDGKPLAKGHCDCLPGYSGANCQAHCSELSHWGCCEIDDDCPSAHVCDRGTKACSNKTNVVQPSNVPDFTYW